MSAERASVPTAEPWNGEGLRTAGAWLGGAPPAPAPEASPQDQAEPPAPVGPFPAPRSFQCHTLRAVVAVGRPGSPGSGRDDGGPPSGRHHLKPGLALCAVLSQQPRKEHHSQRQQKSETRMAEVPGHGARPARRLPRERPPSREPGFGDGLLPRTRSVSSLRNVGAQGSALRDTGL